MKMVNPNLPAPEYIIAAGQPEYLPVIGAKVINTRYGMIPGADFNSLIFAYELSEDDIKTLLEERRLYIEFLTFGGQLQPHIVTIGRDEVISRFTPDRSSDEG